MNRSRALALLALLVVVACRERYDPARDVALKEHLTQMRRALGNYRTDHGHYPHALSDLVPKYLRNIPADPITQQANWRVTTEETVQPSSDFTTGATPAPRSVIVDVHSAAPGADRNGVPYANY